MSAATLAANQCAKDRREQQQRRAIECAAPALFEVVRHISRVASMRGPIEGTTVYFIDHDTMLRARALVATLEDSVAYAHAHNTERQSVKGRR